MEGDGEFKLSPAWRHAMQVLLEQGLEDGTIVQRDELAQLFGLRKPQTAEQQEEYQLAFMGHWQKLKAELLEEYRIDFKTLYGERSYQVVHPKEQTDHAMSEGLRDMRKAARKMARSLAFIRHEQLTDEERKKNADAQAKAAMLAGMIRRPRLPGPGGGSNQGNG